MSPCARRRCPACGHHTFYGPSVRISTFQRGGAGPERRETDDAGGIERVECARCGQAFEADAFMRDGRRGPVQNPAGTLL